MSDDADDIRNRIEELEIMLLALQQSTEALDLFLRPRAEDDDAPLA